MSTLEILESLKTERMEDPNYYDYENKSNSYLKSLALERSEIEKSREKLNDTDSSENEAFISCHKRVCQKSLSEIKSSLPRYNPSLPKKPFGKRFTRKNLKVYY